MKTQIPFEDTPIADPKTNLKTIGYPLFVSVAAGQLPKENPLLTTAFPVAPPEGLFCWRIYFNSNATWVQEAERVPTKTGRTLAA